MTASSKHLQFSNQMTHSEFKNASSPNAATFVAAFLLYQTAQEGQPEKQPWIRDNAQKLYEVCSRNLSNTHCNFTVKLNHYKDDVLWNVYLNICRQPILRQQINHFLNMKDSLRSALDLSSNLVDRIMETTRKKCIECGTVLKRRFRYVQDCKGTIGICYDNKKGPLITIHYTHICQNKDCKSIYWYDRYRTPKGIYFENISDHDQMTSTSTFFTDGTVEECVSFNLDDGKGAPSMTEKYNKRFEDEIDEIKANLITKNQTLGHRQNQDVSLCDKRMLEGVQLRRILMAIQQDLEMTPFISQARIQQYLHANRKLLKSQEIDFEEVYVKEKQWLDSRSLFDMLYDEYEKDINNIQPVWLKYAPVKNNELMLKHFFLQGDGGKKIVRFRCAYPSNMYHQEKKHLQSEMCESTFRSLRCIETPQRGNVTSLVTCPSHSIILHENGCKLKEINRFCQYQALKERIERTTDANKIIKLQESLKEFTLREKKHFGQVKNKIMKTPIRKSQRHTSKTMAKINESLQYEKDNETLVNLENICDEANVNPLLLNNPKLADFVETERQNLDAWDALDGCRGKDQMEETQKESLFCKTGGIQSWMTHSGFILYIHEHVHLETPTAVILSLLHALLATQLHQEYARRLLAIGYDMMCTLYGRMKTLLNADYLTQKSKNLLISLLPHMHVDKFHVASHKNELCIKKGNLFNPYAEKFAAFFKQKGFSNDQIVEQNWKIINKLKWAKNLGRRRFCFMLYDIRKRHNSKNWIRLQKAGYEFVEISKISKIRELNKRQPEIPTTVQLQTEARFQKLQKIVLIKKRRLQSDMPINDSRRKRRRKQM